MTADEVKRMVGRKIFADHWPNTLHNHDAEDDENMKFVGETEDGFQVELSRYAVEADLVIYVNVNLVPMDGGHKSVGVGLCGYKTLKAHHNPHTIRKSDSYMDPDNSELASRVNKIGKIVNENLKIFHIETTVNNRMYDSNLSFLAKNEDDLSEGERLKLKALLFSLSKMPAGLRETVFQKWPAPYELTGVFAGATEPTHQKTIQKSL